MTLMKEPDEKVIPEGALASPMHKVAVIVAVISVGAAVVATGLGVAVVGVAAVAGFDRVISKGAAEPTPTAEGRYQLAGGLHHYEWARYS
jgi:hypothetical protein